ncbi:DUF6634 family protein [Sulfitobacter brevis]
MTTGSDGVCYALAKSIPLEVLKAIEGLAPSMIYIELSQGTGLPVADWLSCKEWLISRLITRMTRRSLDLGTRGPMPGDLDHAPTLSPWFPIWDTQYGGAILIGVQTGHPTLRGKVINTSRLCGLDVDGVWARSATRWYRLGKLAERKDFTFELSGKASLFEGHGISLYKKEKFFSAGRTWYSFTSCNAYLRFSRDLYELWRRQVAFKM